ncbi:N-acetylmuramoyl-L-alanine amidase [Streptomyces sp. NPDC094143]|uniref:peptidoglycan recognition protein family protein n=1 Tax=unclassified Streptomyces TaxID=2593676 RepID=UPI00333204E3
MATPLTADRLVAALRAEGCTVHEVPGWRTNNRNHRGPWGPVHGVQVHHTVTGPGVDVVGLILRGHSTLPGPLATGCITKDGVVHLTGNGRANHAGGGDGRVLQAVIDESYGDRPPATQKHDGSAGAVDGNARFYGWECENEGDGRDPWPARQYDAIVRATAAICRAHGWSAKSAIGHLEWSDWKVDPRGFAMTDFRADVAERLAHPASWNPGDADTPEEDDEMKLSDQVRLGEWIAKQWPNDKGLQDRQIPVDVALGSGYAHSRKAAENTVTILAQLGAQQATIDKLVDAIGSGGGLTAAEIKAAAEAGAQAALDRLGDALKEN